MSSVIKCKETLYYNHVYFAYSEVTAIKTLLVLKAKMLQSYKTLFSNYRKIFNVKFNNYKNYKLLSK